MIAPPATQRASNGRYERKYASAVVSAHELEEMVLLHPALFREIYQRRFVNNVYFDTPDRSAYREAVRGNSARLKIRIRWYGDLVGIIERPTLEFKHKRGLAGAKEQFPLEPFRFDEDFRWTTLQHVLGTTTLPEKARLQLAMCEPVLANRYRRRYFQSADGRFRVTIDAEMRFVPLEASGRPHLHAATATNQTVLEIKYDRESDADAAGVLHGFPLRLTKSSKYVLGVASSDDF